MPKYNDYMDQVTVDAKLKARILTNIPVQKKKLPWRQFALATLSICALVIAIQPLLAPKYSRNDMNLAVDSAPMDDNTINKDYYAGAELSYANGLQDYSLSKFTSQQEVEIAGITYTLYFGENCCAIYYFDDEGDYFYEFPTLLTIEELTERINNNQFGE